VTESFTWALAWVCVATFGFGIWSANILALHVDVFPAGRLGTALGVTGAAASLAGAGAAFAVGHLLDGHGYDRLFFAAGAAPLLAVTVLGFALRQKGGQDLT
jgi:sugar phosphate permease